MHFYFPQTKLREGNVFTPVCQSFCSQGDVTKIPRTETPVDRESTVKSGLYASYWNAFLSSLITGLSYSEKKDSLEKRFICTLDGKSLIKNQIGVAGTIYILPSLFTETLDVTKFSGFS